MGSYVLGPKKSGNWEVTSFQNSFPDPSVARSYQMLISSGGSERPTRPMPRVLPAATAQKVAMALFSRAKATGLLIHITVVQLMDTSRGTLM